jgi:hypothetical protein
MNEIVFRECAVIRVSKLEKCKGGIFEHTTIEAESKINFTEAENQRREPKGSVAFGLFLR